MNYSIQELGFILYNNRSIKNVVSNWLPLYDVNALKLIKYEDLLNWCKNQYNENEKFVEIPIKDLLINEPDVSVSPSDVISLTDVVMSADLSDFEKNWLYQRGIDDEMILKWNLKSMSKIPIKYADILGIKSHPILTNILNDGIDGGGIIIPLLENDKLINCTFRKISDVGKLKYTQTCPDVSVWNLNKSKKEVWIVEGLFDMMAIEKNNQHAISISSAMWSGLQLYQTLDNYDTINIWADRDQTGYRCAAILSRFFRMIGVNVKVYQSKYVKDAAEHFLENKLTWDDVEEIKITKEMIELHNDQSFNFIKYLKNRKF